MAVHYRTKMKAKSKRNRSLTKIEIVDNYIYDILDEKILSSVELKKQVAIIVQEFKEKKIEVNKDLYDKYLKIGNLFFQNVFPFQCFAMAMSLCTFYKGTSRARWNKIFNYMGRGNGKDSNIAWYSTCLTSVYHGIKHYDIDIIANNMEQSLRPIDDIKAMVREKSKERFFEKIGDSIISYDTESYINARSSDAKMQDGLRSGAVIFNEVHAYQNYSKLNVMITGLGKIDDPRTFYFTTNGEERGSVLDDMMDTAQDVLNGLKDDRRTLYLIYKLDSIDEINETQKWVKANPLLPYRETLLDEIEDEYDLWKQNPNNMPSFPQKRMNLPISSNEMEVVPWEVILKTNQEYDFDNLKGMDCVLGLDTSKTTDWTAINFLFYDYDIDKYICINHAFICGNNRDLAGIKAPFREWCEQGYGTIIDDKEVSPDYVINYAMNFAEENDFNIVSVVIDNFKKGLYCSELEKFGYMKENENLSIIRPSDIAEVIPIIERTFLNERFVWGDNAMLRWATNNTKVIQWKRNKTTGDNDMGNQLYAKINARFRKTDPFMAMVHSMIRRTDIEEEYIDYDDILTRGF